MNDLFDKDLLNKIRYFLKDTIRQSFDFALSDQSRGIEMPPLQKPPPSEAKRIDLVKNPEWANIPDINLIKAINERQSRRKYSETPLNLEELSFLLWTSQGIKQFLKNGAAFRTVPSAGSRHSMETYLVILNVENLSPGVYRYLPVEHQLVFEFAEDDMIDKINAAVLNQSFAGKSAVVFVWTAIPYRMEWRYGLASHKVIAMDAGHACQNLYLACEAIGAGTCAIAAYDQEQLDSFLRVDGEEEFAIYAAPVGKID